MRILEHVLTIDLCNAPSTDGAYPPPDSSIHDLLALVKKDGPIADIEAVYIRFFECLFRSVAQEVRHQTHWEATDQSGLATNWYKLLQERREGLYHEVVASTESKFHRCVDGSDLDCVAVITHWLESCDIRGR